MTNDIRYDTWLHWQLTSFCNLNCKYCISWINGKKFKPQPIDIEKVISTLDKSGKIFKIHFTGGGEPFMCPNLKELCVELTKNHYISFNSNLTSPKIKNFIHTINPDRIIQFHASTHLEELFDKKLTDRFVENFKLIKSKNIPIRASVVAYPSLRKNLTFYKEFFRERGIQLNFDLFIGKYNGKIYPRDYTKKELDDFGIVEDWTKKYVQKKRKCNAGGNVGLVMANGNIYPCSNVYMNLGNIFKEVKFKDYMIYCPSLKCDCPFNQIDAPLFKKAIKISNGPIRKMSPIINSIKRNLIYIDYYRTRNM